jgi:hypothetical protein
VDKIYVSTNSYIGFGSNDPHLCVGNHTYWKITKLYYEEGKLSNGHKFLRIRWIGFTSQFYSTTKSYDVIIWSTGDISLRMLTAPSSWNSGSYQLEADVVYSYTANSAYPNITFYNNGNGFLVERKKIVLNPRDYKYLVRSGQFYYTIVNSELLKLDIDTLNAVNFQNFGVSEMPSYDLIKDLNEPELLCWSENNKD